MKEILHNTLHLCVYLISIIVIVWMGSIYFDIVPDASVVIGVVVLGKLIEVCNKLDRGVE